LSGALFSENEIKGRYLDLFEIAEEFCLNFNEGANPPLVEVDPALLYMVVVATYDDISRYKAFHLTDPTTQRSNAVKRAAYATKWILHFDPLIFPTMGHASGTSGHTHDALANAIFAMHISLSNLQQFTGVKFDLSQKLYYDLLYDLVYRQLGSDALMLIYDMVCDVALKNSIIE
jgi:hypothetical protein